MERKYYWLKLKNDFFSSKEMKLLRKIAGGDTYTIIYLKLQLLSLKNEGRLFFDGIVDTFAEELAIEIDEDVDNVKATILFLTKCGLAEMTSDTELLLTSVPSLVGSESAVTERVRKHREQQKVLQCNADVTQVKQKCNTEIEIEIEKDIEKDIDIYNNNRGVSDETGVKRSKFIPPSVDEVRQYCLERNNTVDAEAFVDFYESKGWLVGKNKMKDWKAAVRTWEKNRQANNMAKVKKYGKKEELDDFYEMVGDWANE